MISEITVPAVQKSEESYWTGAVRADLDRDAGIAFANPYLAPLEVTLELLGPGLEIERQV